MKQFSTIEKLDTGILYLLELASNLSVLLLAFGLIASMANVLTKGAVLIDNLVMQRVWAWTQCIAIDAGLAAARARGRVGRRPRKLKTNGKVALAQRVFVDSSHTIPEICAALGISRATLYRYVKQAESTT